MHTPECPPSARSARDDEHHLELLRAWAREGWPKGAPAEIDVSTLPAAGALSSKLRIPEACEEFPWVGVWGNFQGLRIGFSPSESFQIFGTAAFPYPFLSDMYLSADTGGTGIVSIAAFRTRDAALAFGGQRPSYTGKIPGGGVFTPSDTQTNPTGIPGAESFLMVWDANSAQWKRSAGSPLDTDGLTATVGAQITRSWNYGYDLTSGAWDRQRGYGNSADALTPVVINAGNGIFPGVSSFGFVMNDRTTNIDRMRQPDSRQAFGSVGSNISLAATGLKTSFTVGTNKNSVWMGGTIRHTAGGATAVVQVELVRSAVTYLLTPGLTVAAASSASLMPSGAVVGMPLVSGDVIQVNCTTALAGETADIVLSGMTDRFTF